jgi:hypothetical protein
MLSKQLKGLEDMAFSASRYTSIRYSMAMMRTMAISMRA